MPEITIVGLIADFQTSEVLAQKGAVYEYDAPEIDRILSVYGAAEELVADPDWEFTATAFIERNEWLIAEMNRCLDEVSDRMKRDIIQNLKIIADRPQPESRRVRVHWGLGDEASSVTGVLSRSKSGFYRVTGEESRTGFLPHQVISRVEVDAFCPSLMLDR